MSERELTPEGGDGAGLWLLLGCGGLALVGLCLVPPAVVFFLWEGGTETVEPVVQQDPALVPDEPPPPPSSPILGGGPGQPPPPDPGATSARSVTFRVTESTGVPAVRTGSSCTFPVTRHDRTDGTFWCRAEVRCGGQLLYGGGTAGYFDCTLYEQPQRHVVGQDFDTTSGDRDAAFRVDTLRAEVEIRDDARGALGAFVVRGTVTEIR